MKTIKLTDEQFKTLERIVQYEFDQEEIYQLDNGEHDTTLLEDLFDIQVAMLKAEYDIRYLLDAHFVKIISEEIQKKINDVKALKERE